MFQHVFSFRFPRTPILRRTIPWPDSCGTACEHLHQASGERAALALRRRRFRRRRRSAHCRLNIAHTVLLHLRQLVALTLARSRQRVDLHRTIAAISLVVTIVRDVIQFNLLVQITGSSNAIFFLQISHKSWV